MLIHSILTVLWDWFYDYLPFSLYILPFAFTSPMCFEFLDNLDRRYPISWLKKWRFRRGPRLRPRSHCCWWQRWTHTWVCESHCFFTGVSLQGSHVLCNGVCVHEPSPSFKCDIPHLWRGPCLPVWRFSNFIWKMFPFLDYGEPWAHGFTRIRLPFNNTLLPSWLEAIKGESTANHSQPILKS